MRETASEFIMTETFSQKIYRWATAVFACDPRSLALFRVVMGVLILVDIAMRWPDLQAFTTDLGVVDRTLANQLLQLDYGGDTDLIWSLNFFSGELWFQQTLMALQASAAVGLILGCWTRLATLVSWILLVSLHMRCPIILTSGDTLLRCLLFWSLFTPLGHCWSVDAALAKRHLPHSPEPILTGGTAGLISQMIIMYFFAGIAKWNDVWWQGDAMDYVLRLDIYARPWANSLLEFPVLLKLISWSTLFAEVFLILLMLIPWQNTWWRVVNLSVYIALHLSIAATMSIGLFSYISLLGWIPIVPAALWQIRLFSRFRFDPLAGYRSDPYTELAPTLIADDQTRQWAAGFQRLGSGLACLMVGYILLWNVANIPNTYDGDLRVRLQLSDQEFLDQIAARRPFAMAMPGPLRWIGLVTGTAQHFQMFGVPPLINPWFVYDATLEDGKHIDIMRLDNVSEERPASILYSISGHHWRKLHRNLLNQEYQPVRERLAEYKIRQWNQSHREGKQIRSLRVLCYAEKTGPQYMDQPPQVNVWYGSVQPPIESLDELQKLLDGNPNLLPGL